jgi:hypothetical protein
VRADIKIGLRLAILLACASRALSAATVRAPLVGNALALNPAFSWYTEVRIWNPTDAVALVTITDVIGSGMPARTSFNVPAEGVLDLPVYYFFYSSAPPPPGGTYDPSLFALVEFTSAAPIQVFTQFAASNSDLAGPRPATSPPAFPYFGGPLWAAVAGPVIPSFNEYIPAGTKAGLPWLTSDVDRYRTNLYLINPSAEALTVTATFISADGGSTATKTYSVPPRDLMAAPDIFADPAIAAIDGANANTSGSRQGAATVQMIASGPFYAFASVIANDISCDIHNRFAIVQPVILP